MLLKVLLLILLVLVVAAVAAVLHGASRWRSETRALQAKMRAARLPTGTRTYDPRELEGLPAPAQRYLRAALKEKTPLVSAVRLEHAGTFNLSPTSERWRSFRSIQHVTTQRPAFLWDARIHMTPGIDVFVHDAYVAGEGILRAKLFGLLTVMEQPPTPELAHGELMRFMAEAAWYPTALLPSQGVHWEPIDDTSARASLTDDDISVSLEFHFDEAGLIRTVRSPGRYRLVNGASVATPWVGRFWDYEPRDGMLVPLEGEVAWMLVDGARPYWRGRIDRVEYEYVP